MEQKEEKLRNAYDTAAKRIRDKGGSQAEHEYAKAYQNLVKAGFALQLKRKYRAFI